MSKKPINLSSIIIRELQPCDHDGALTLTKEMHETLRKIYRPSKSAKPINESNIPFKRIGAILDDKVIGMVTYEREGNALYFGSLGVLREFKRQGIARKLIEFIKIEARELGLSRITCSTVLETGNEAIFHNLGFKTTSTILTDKFISKEETAVHEISFEKNVV